MNRRDFLLNSGATTVAAASLSFTPARALAIKSSGEPNNMTWQRYNSKNSLNSLTISASQMPARDDLLRLAEESIPSKERIQQITQTVLTHTIAEERNDLATTMATLAENPVYEDVASGKTFVGHQNVFEDYKKKFKAFPEMKRHVTNFMVDKNGCFAELMWEGTQKGPLKGIKPPRNRPKIYLPISVYYAVNEQGLITRETVYYDQYLMMLNLDLIPDIANSPLTLALLNPGLITRRE